MSEFEWFASFYYLYCLNTLAFPECNQLLYENNEWLKIFEPCADRGLQVVVRRSEEHQRVMDCIWGINNDHTTLSDNWECAFDLPASSISKDANTDPR